MKRNAFISNRDGEVFLYEPDFANRPLSHDTVQFKDALEDVTAAHGGAVCLSSLVTVDALLSLMQIIKGELEARTGKFKENKEITGEVR